MARRRGTGGSPGRARLTLRGTRASAHTGRLRLVGVWRSSACTGARVTLARQALGLDGEQRARRALEARGYRVIDARYRTRHGEIDLVARHDAWVVFVEVKARRSGRFGDPADWVTPRKQQRLVAMALEYLGRHRLTRAAVRFDVVTVDHAGGDAPRVTIIADAFRPGW